VPQGDLFFLWSGVLIMVGWNENGMMEWNGDEKVLGRLVVMVVLGLWVRGGAWWGVVWDGLWDDAAVC
jgi:hypothetical protein